MRLEIEPISRLADEAPSVKVINSSPESMVTISVTVTDAKDHRWKSRNVFRTDSTGVVDISRDAPVSGSYAFTDPAGPIWSMRFASEDIPPSMFAAPWDQLEFTFTADAGGETTSAGALCRWSGPGVTRSEIRGNGFVGFLFEPSGDGPHPAVAIIPGTTGTQSMEPTAALLASRGYTAMVVGYMGLERQSKTLCEMPLETLAAGIRWLWAHPSVDSEHVGVMCASVGTEGTLAALSEIEDLGTRAVVAIAPSSVIWQALAEGRPPKKSSWTLGGEPLPWVPMHGERLVPELIKNALLKRLSRHPRSSALRLRSAYSAGLHDRAAVEKAEIHVERIEAPILFVSGNDDQMWPAAEMVSALMRRRAQGRGSSDRHLSFAHAGHIIRPPYTPTTVTWTEDLYSGGSPEGNATASVEAWTEILRFLDRCLRARESSRSRA
jgi:dienelactone hydrolase